MSLAWGAGRALPIPEEELNEALRRAVVVRAVGGSPEREVSLDEDAVERLAEELDSAERRFALLHELDSLRDGLRSRRLRVARRAARGRRSRVAVLRGRVARRRARVGSSPVVSGSGDWPHEHTAETEALGLTAAERQILAALAVVGHASLSADELADLGVTSDVIPLLEDLERRGLIRLDERRRYSVLRGVGEQLRRTDSALTMGDRLLDHFSTLARNGALTPARLDDDAEAILGLAAWAAEAGRFPRLLELVKTLEAAFGIAQRSGQWLTLLERARTAARVLGDRQSEIWALRQMAAAAAATGDSVSAQRHLREADELQYGPQQVVTREVTSETPGSRAAASTAGVARRRSGMGAVDARHRRGAGRRRRARLRTRRRRRLELAGHDGARVRDDHGIGHDGHDGR